MCISKAILAICKESVNNLGKGGKGNFKAVNAYFVHATVCVRLLNNKSSQQSCSVIMSIFRPTMGISHAMGSLRNFLSLHNSCDKYNCNKNKVQNII